MYGGWTTCVRVETADGHDLVFDCGSGFRNCAIDLQARWGDRPVARTAPVRQPFPFRPHRRLRPGRRLLRPAEHDQRLRQPPIPLGAGQQPGDLLAPRGGRGPRRPHAVDVRDHAGRLPRVRDSRFRERTPADDRRRSDRTAGGSSTCVSRSGSGGRRSARSRSSTPPPASPTASTTAAGASSSAPTTSCAAGSGRRPRPARQPRRRGPARRARPRRGPALPRRPIPPRRVRRPCRGSAPPPPSPGCDWGHSCIEDVIEMVRACRVRRTLIGHHDPNRDWSDRNRLDTMLAQSGEAECTLEMARAETVIEL